VGHFELFSDSETPVFSINRFALHFEGDSAAQMNLEFVPGYRLAAVEPFGPTFTEINIQSDEVRFSAKGNLKEGQFNIEGAWDVDAGRLELHHGMRDVPVKHLLSLAQHWELFPMVPVTVKNAWARC